jgi:ubiquitin thioesterase OTU1
MQLLTGFPPVAIPALVGEGLTVGDLGLDPGEPLTVRPGVAVTAPAAPVAAAPVVGGAPRPAAPAAPPPAEDWARTYGDDIAADEDAALAAAIAASLEAAERPRGAPPAATARPSYGDVSTCPQPHPPPLGGRGHKPGAGGAPTAVPLPDGSGRLLARRVVPANNSCAFATVGLLVRGSRDAWADLRAVVASAVLADPVTYSAAVLECPPAEYATKICHPKTWGGAVDLSILADWARVELAAGDIATRRVDVYGSGKGFTRRGWLLYDGLHYDAVAVCASEADESLDERTLPLGCATAAAADAAFASLLDGFHRARAFTDTARFTLRCGVCGAGVEGEKEAVAHARETGHSNFAEY